MLGGIVASKVKIIERLLPALPTLALAFGDCARALDPGVDLILVVGVVAQTGIDVLWWDLQIANS